MSAGLFYYLGGPDNPFLSCRMPDVRAIVDLVEQTLGRSASAAEVERVAEMLLAELTRGAPTGGNSNASMNRAIVTAYGYDKQGILAEITRVVSDSACNILDVSQKILQGYFTLIMLIEVGSQTTIQSLQQKLSGTGQQLQVRIVVQHEDLFNAMHRP